MNKELVEKLLAKKQELENRIRQFETDLAVIQSAIDQELKKAEELFGTKDLNEIKEQVETLSSKIEQEVENVKKILNETENI